MGKKRLTGHEAKKAQKAHSKNEQKRQQIAKKRSSGEDAFAKRHAK
jgi:hypothetical protein